MSCALMPFLRCVHRGGIVPARAYFHADALSLVFGLAFRSSRALLIVRRPACATDTTAATIRQIDSADRHVTGRIGEGPCLRPGG